MLREMAHVRQPAGEPPRRWFSSRSRDLIVWLDPKGGVGGFQLCYDREGEEKVLTWRAPDSYSHAKLDDGEGRTYRHKASPILAGGAPFDAKAVAAGFWAEAAEIPAAIAELVYRKLLSCPRGREGSGK